jgi:chemotaxis signal transduction protein
MTAESTTGNRRTTGKSKHEAQKRSRGLCTFWLSQRLFGLDVALVGEVVTVETVIPVPGSPPFVRGLFSLRGTPLTLLDLGRVLGLEETGTTADRTIALVVRHDEMVVAFAVDQMEGVVPPERGSVTAPTVDEHPAIASFLMLDDASGRVVTVFEQAYVLERLEAARFLKELDG